ncbi:hypothetical protein BU23DRAFT_542799 [Bimuria novae-zelandiae CBS 107.79]|uniref:N-acetylgalactosaminide beta-1,3-galactosyltransferase n=1 Tax=Bimuria novae-zelandiae CBS 107.79 TaxID=1447943 RepID=A0A6A5UUQ0_9PLEO|nr:hypothetical protein BU23DRAFT_542799 [Bimuria novae-zelandiae CBS 107.79]
MLLRQAHFTTITVVCIPIIFAIFVFVSYFHDGTLNVIPSHLSLRPSHDEKPASQNDPSHSTSAPSTNATPAEKPHTNIENEEEPPQNVNSPAAPSTPSTIDQKVFPQNDWLPARPIDPSCAHLPDLSKVLLIIKTGASETYDRLPTQFMTMARCLPDFLVFSDMEESIMGYRVYDILGDTLKEVKDGNSDFNLWRRQQECLVDQKSCQKWSNVGTEAWNLDKYKNVRQSDVTYTMRPHYDWYIHIDADTYIHWPNMIDMLKPFDPKKDYFFGSFEPSQYGDFNHGGSGYILSQSAMQKFHANSSVEHFDHEARNICCGDMLMTIAVRENIGLANTNMFPTINGRKPFTLPFGPRQWCQPIATLHKLNSEEVGSIWQYEQERFVNATDGKPAPLLIKDLYYKYFAPRLTDKLEDWDNMYDDYLNNVWYYIDYDDKSKDWEHFHDQKYVWHRRKPKDHKHDEEKNAHKSFENCKKACDVVDECLQFRWQDDACAMSKNFRLGNPMEHKDGKERWTSGWAVKKIEKWIADQGECQVKFPEA